MTENLDCSRMGRKDMEIKKVMKALENCKNHKYIGALPFSKA